MNWFTKKDVSNTSKEKLVDLVIEWGGCVHVEKDPYLTHTVVYENDSFGKEGYCYCKECYDKALEEEDSKKYTCVDCKTEKKAKDMISWRWYDFYSAQGDEPVWVCNCCVTKENHILRVKRDNQDRFDELGY